MRKSCFAALLVCVLLFAAQALAHETSPLGASVPAQSAARVQLAPFGSNRSCNGVAASSKWLNQARLGNRFVSLRLYTTQGDQITFQEKLVHAQSGTESIRLLLRGAVRGETIMLQLDQPALHTLLTLGITEIVVADTDLYVQAEYRTQDLQTLRSRFQVGAEELLCVSGEDQPVTVVGVDGVRRYLTR